MIKKIDHLGIAVTDLDAQVAQYRDKMGLTFDGIEEVPSQMARVAFFQVGETKIELVASLSPDGPIAKHIERRGEGMHHIAYQVGDIEAAIAWAKGQGMQPLTETARPGAHHTLVCFLHPKTTGGVLTELVQKLATDGH